MIGLGSDKNGSHLNRGRYKNIKGVLLVEGFPVRFHVAEVRSRVVGAHLKYLQAGVHLRGKILSEYSQYFKSVYLVENLLAKVLSPVARDVSK